MPFGKAVIREFWFDFIVQVLNVLNKETENMKISKNDKQKLFLYTYNLNVLCVKSGYRLRSYPLIINAFPFIKFYDYFKI